MDASQGLNNLFRKANEVSLCTVDLQKKKEIQYRIFFLYPQVKQKSADYPNAEDTLDFDSDSIRKELAYTRNLVCQLSAIMPHSLDRVIEESNRPKVCGLWLLLKICLFVCSFVKKIYPRCCITIVYSSQAFSLKNLPPTIVQK